MRRRRRSTAARLLAVAALAGAGLAVVVVVSNTDSGSSGPSSSSSSTTPGASVPAPFRGHFYRVRKGDSLGLISEKSQVAIGTLRMLNPGLDPNSLDAGQRIKLRRLRPK